MLYQREIFHNIDFRIALVYIFLISALLEINYLRIKWDNKDVQIYEWSTQQFHFITIHHPKETKNNVCVGLEAFAIWKLWRLSW